jgi:outer membrane protein OmpA-like peptidoglycan-associated protein
MSRRKVPAVSLALMLAILIMVAGSGIYLTLRVRQQAAGVGQATANGGLVGTAASIRSADTSPYPEWKPSGDAPTVPLLAGLTIVGAVNQKPLGDLETITLIRSVGPDTVGLTVSSETGDSPDPRDGPDPSGAQADHVVGHRIVSRGDLDAAHRIEELFNDDLFPQSMPGTTAFSLSAAVLNELTSHGASQVTYRAARYKSVLKGAPDISVEGSIDGVPDRTTPPTDAAGEDDVHIRCTLKRVEKNDVAFPVILNNQRTTVPAIHAHGTSEFETSDWYILDDPRNPLLLSLRLDGTDDRVQVVDIAFPTDHGPTELERTLSESGHTDIHGIHFNFKSASMRQESQTALEEIAAALARNASWTLNIGDCTDNTGGDRFNLELSGHRAEAVKRELVTRYHIADSRLTTAGFGASKAKESDDTLEGRARNRRVELVLR